MESSSKLLARYRDSSELEEDFLNELRESEHQRLQWVPILENDHREWAMRRKTWEQRLALTLQALRDAGGGDVADKLSARLLTKRLVSSPGDFGIYWEIKTKYGKETISVYFEGTADDSESHAASTSGSDDESCSEAHKVSDNEATCLACRTVDRGGETTTCGRCKALHHTHCIGLEGVGAGSWPCRACGHTNDIPPSQLGVREHTPHWQEFLRLAEPVVVNMTPGSPVGIRRPPEWISWARPGTPVAFYFDCPCDKMLAPVCHVEPSAATHDLVSRHFHLNPFTQLDMLEHLRVEHDREYKDIGDALAAYGTSVETNHLTQWDIAANNYAAQQMYSQLRQDWAALLHHHTHGQPSDYIPTRSVGEASLVREGLEKYVSRWAEGGDCEWLLFCTVPDCTLGAVRGSSAARHFRSHGFELDKRQIIQLFGYQVLRERPSITVGSASSHAGPVAAAPDDHDKTAEKHSPRPKTRALVTNKSRPRGRPPKSQTVELRVIKKRTHYYMKQPANVLEEFCRSSGLQFSEVSHNGRNAILAWKLAKYELTHQRTPRIGPSGYLRMGVKEMKALCLARGLSLEDMPAVKPGAWLADTLTRSDGISKRTRSQRCS